MSIKSEIRLIEQQEVSITNSKFLKDTEGWVGTGTTTWTHGSFNNTIRKISGNTTRLSQTLSITGETISLNYFSGSKPYRVDYVIMGDNNTGSTFTPYLGGIAGTTRTENGTYYDIFYVGVGSLLTINDSNDHFLINSTTVDVLIWG